MRRRVVLARLTVAGLLAALGAGGLARPASAHPLGNLSVNHFHGLTIGSDRVVDDAVVDTAEIPTAQAGRAVDADGDGTASRAELTAYGQEQCGAMRAAVRLSVDDRPVAFAVTAASFEHHPGQAGLDTSTLTCRLEAAVDVRSARTIAFSDTYLADRVGWREITATGDGVTLASSSVPVSSVSGRLQHYPTDLLTSPLDVREATVTVALPGAASAPSPTVARPGFSLEALGPFAGVVERVNRSFDDLVGRRQLTLGIGSLAIAMALLLGASHALLPGHGKTVMAAYIAGRQGSVGDAVLVGVTVTGTHTGGVLLLGLAVSASATLAAESVLGWLGVTSGLLIAALGLGLFRSARRHRSWEWTGHGHSHGGHTHAGHTVGDHDHDHDHDHDLDHDHDHDQVAPRPGHVSRRGLVGMGVAGGLVPSPSALVVLLSAIALGRTLFGVVLVVAYGVGMAGTLTLAGVLLVRVRDRLQRRSRAGSHRVGRLARSWTAAAPYVTAGLVIVVGAGLAVRSLRLV